MQDNDRDDSRNNVRRRAGDDHGEVVMRQPVGQFEEKREQPQTAQHGGEEKPPGTEVPAPRPVGDKPGAVGGDVRQHDGKCVVAVIHAARPVAATEFEKVEGQRRIAPQPGDRGQPHRRDDEQAEVDAQDRDQVCSFHVTARKAVRGFRHARAAMQIVRI